MYHLLQGLRIVDLTTIVLGPYATQILGDLGADVIKVEPPEGDLYRAARPGRARRHGRGLHGHQPQQALHRRRSEAPKRAKRWCAAWRRAPTPSCTTCGPSRRRSSESITRRGRENPRLVYCFSAGFGPKALGRRARLRRHHPGRLGPCRIEHRFHRRAALSAHHVADKVIGLHLAIAVLAGVVHRDSTGEGTGIETPMFESMVSVSHGRAHGRAGLRAADGRAGYERLLGADRRPYPPGTAISP